MLEASKIDEVLPWKSPDFRANPYPWYARLQRDFPVLQTSEKDFVVTRYDDYMEFVRHPSMTVVEPTWVPDNAWHALRNTVLFIEPPKHTHMRRQTNKWFTPKLVKDWVKICAEEAGKALDSMGMDGCIEAHQHLCINPTHITMCRILDVPEEDVESALVANDKILGALSPTSGEAEERSAVQAFEFLSQRCKAMIDRKRENPGNGLVDSLLESQRKGEMTEEEVLQTVVLFYFSGAPNPSYVLASAIEHFARNPETFTLYRTNPASRALVINELIRLYPPELSFVRFTTADVEIRNVQIPAGSRVRFMTAAANRDENVFCNPNLFDHTRPPEKSQNLSFGTGTHSCAGQLISRAEIESVLTVIAERFERIEITDQPTMNIDDRVRNYLTLPIRLY
ncbi:cytochrome P450 [Burkholderia sp. Ac-20344]|uniref:cytochrome P450 n=1 Tax=Burkholderia sp. Ac-20344 TaxID=2703890 RepID=UPI00197B81EB|nr:cytochrome P450 [Burkholderia sp. Ac-20344]MBN3836727.1 cytochrome P450 [Burkholderia sp. Ac-20344]